MKLTHDIRNNQFETALLIVLRLGKKYRMYDGVKPITYKWDFKRKDK